MRPNDGIDPMSLTRKLGRLFAYLVAFLTPPLGFMVAANWPIEAPPGPESLGFALTALAAVAVAAIPVWVGFHLLAPVAEVTAQGLAHDPPQHTLTESGFELTMPQTLAPPMSARCSGGCSFSVSEEWLFLCGSQRCGTNHGRVYSWSCLPALPRPG